MNTNVDTSIVIATRNRAIQLDLCLVSIKRAFEPSTTYEIIIVDNASSDNTVEVASKYSSILPITYLLEHRLGSSYARNAGAEIARGKWLIFIDDDCIFRPEYGVTWRRLVNSGYYDFIGGQVLPASAKDHVGIVLSSFRVIPPYTRVIPVGLFLCSNLSVTSDVFRRLKGFDAS